MPTRDDIDEMLLRYLKREEEDPIRRRLQAAADWQMDHDKKDDARHGEVIKKLEHHSWRIGRMEEQAETIADDVEDSKKHDVEELRKKAKRADDLIWKVVTGVLLAAAGVETYLRVTGH